MRRTYHHVLLLASLLLVVGVRPFLGGQVLGFDVLEIVLLVGLVGAGLTVTEKRRWRVSLLVLTAASVITRLMWLGGASEEWLVAFLTTTSCLYLVIVVLVVTSFFRSTDGMTSHALLAALSAYLTIGVVWSMLYALLSIVAPGSFQMGAGGAIGAADFDRFLGFSFATLTTLGYGNIAPATARADALTTIEAVIGQMYVAVVIARLVAAQLSRSDDS